MRQVTVLFDSRLLAFFGKYAYTLYLVHMIGLQTANSLNVPAVARFVIAFAIALGVAITLSYAIERRGIILGDKIIKAVRWRKLRCPARPPRSVRRHRRRAPVVRHIGQWLFWFARDQQIWGRGLERRMSRSAQLVRSAFAHPLQAEQFEKMNGLT